MFCFSFSLIYYNFLFLSCSSWATSSSPWRCNFSYRLNYFFRSPNSTCLARISHCLFCVIALKCFLPFNFSMFYLMFASMFFVRLNRVFFLRSDCLERPRNLTTDAVVVALINKVRRAIPATCKRTTS